MNQKILVILSALAIISLGAVVYSNSISGQLLLDDINMIKDNVYVKSLSNIPLVFTKDIDSGAARVSNFYRPLQIFTYMLEYHFSGLDPRGYHITNIILHIAVALLVLWLLWLLFGNGLLAFFAAALFVVHPVHTEAVSYISGRADPMVALFVILGLIFYIKDDRSDNIFLYALSLVSYFLGLLSRESALIFMALVILYHLSFRRKLRISRAIPVLVVTAVYFVLRTAVLKELSHVAQPTTVLQRLPGFFVAVTNYTKILFLPFDLHMEHGLALFKFSDPKAILGILVLAALFMAIAAYGKGRPLISFAIGWIVLSILPMSNIYPINAYMAEHWLYLPSIGFCLLVSAGLVYLSRKKILNIAAAIIMAGLIIFFSSRTMAQNMYWKDNITFYTETLKYAPNSFLMWNNLGNIYNDMGRKPDAIECYKRSIAINPRYGSAYISMGSVLDDLGRRDEAVEMFKKAVEIDPKDYVLAYVNLGIIYAATGKPDEAEAAYKKAIETAPSLAYAYSGLGMIYFARGDADKAIELCNKAIEMNPDLPNSYNDLGLVYGALGKLPQSIAAYRKAAELNPRYGAARYNLAVSYFKNGQYDLAIKEYDAALSLGIIPKPVFTELIEKYRSGETK